MNYYEVKIITGDGDAIEIGKEEIEQKIIRSVKIMFDTTDEKNLLQKSSSMLAKITITGDISSDVKDKLIKIFNWSKDFSNATTYRQVVLTIKSDETTVMRTYEYGNMYVCDYTEEYEGENSGGVIGTFELKIFQKENSFKSIDTY